MTEPAKNLQWCERCKSASGAANFCSVECEADATSPRGALVRAICSLLDVGQDADDRTIADTLRILKQEHSEAEQRANDEEKRADAAEQRADAAEATAEDRTRLLDLAGLTEHEWQCVRGHLL